MNWKIRPDFGLTLSYRYYWLGDVKTGGTMTVIGHGAGKSKPFVENVGQTHARLDVQAMMLSVWKSFGDFKLQ